MKMYSRLRVKTKCKEEDDSGDQPISPSAQYFGSKAMSVCVLAVLEFEVPIDISRLSPLVKDLFLPINPRFSSIMASEKGVRRWKRVEVNIQDHVKIPTFPDGLTPEKYDAHFDEYLTKTGMEPFSEENPLWEIHFIRYPTSKAAGNAIFKLHHSLGDGYSLMGALLSCLQRADDPSLPLTFPSTRRLPKANDFNKSMNVLLFVPRTLYSLYTGMYDFGWSFAKSAFNADVKTPIRSGSEGVGFHPALKISALAFSLVKLKQIGTKLDVTINSVLAGIIFLGVRQYMQETGGDCFRKSRSTMAVVLNTRSINGYMSIEDMLKPFTAQVWGNQFAFLHVSLPELTTHNCSNPLDFVSEAHNAIMRKKTSPAVYLTGHFLEIVRKCKGAETAAEYVKGALKNASLAFSNLIGPIEKMSLADHPIKGLYYMPCGSHQSLTITAMSYEQTLRIGIGTELGFIDSQKFNSSMEKAYDQIYAAATSTMR